mgnify:CR=1 FL=1
MKRAFSALLLFALVFCTACAGAWVNTYRAGALTKGVVTEVHKEAWSEPLRARVEKCDAEVPEEDGQLEALEACLKPYTRDNNEHVKQSLAAYNTAAAALGAILIATEDNPKGVDKDALQGALVDTVAAAKELLSAFPESKKWIDRLDKLLKGFL